MISQNKIPGASRILSVCIRNHFSPAATMVKLQKAIEGSYRPRKDWTQMELDLAFLAKAAAGTRVLYALQKGEGYPSDSTLKVKKPIPELVVTSGPPPDDVIGTNISGLLGEKGKPPPPSGQWVIGQTVMIDGVALEESCRYHHRIGNCIGLCREHCPPHLQNLTITKFEDIKDIQKAIESGECHFGRDGTVLAIAPVTATENYLPVPLIFSPSCKTETGKELALWVQCVLDVYRTHKDGQEKHGLIYILATDGEASFRVLRFLLGLTQQLDHQSPIGKILYELPGLNCVTGQHNLITTCDPKHIVKRFATLIRSSLGVQIGHLSLSYHDFHKALTDMAGLTPHKADTLLNPADKQNVPKAVNLLQTLEAGGSKVPTYVGMTYEDRLPRVYLVAKTLSCFLLPFITVEMTLSEQLQSLSTYSHLITAFFRNHRTSFMNSALFADSQAIVKSIFFTAARLQVEDPSINYYILFDGTDRLEGLFSNARTQDHARNFDALQLANKLCVGAEVNAIYERYPQLSRGHVRRNLSGARGIDHVNPASWTGNVNVGQVDLKGVYLKGREEANEILSTHLKPNELAQVLVNWDELFGDPNIDHLRPNGQYVGYRPQDNPPEFDNDHEELTGGLLSLDMDDEFADGQDFTSDTSPIGLEVDIPQGSNHDQEVDIPSDPMAGSIINQIAAERESETVNPTVPHRLESPYLDMPSGKRRHIDSLFAEFLVSDRARKTIIRTLRARDVTKDESMGSKRPDEDEEVRDEEGVVKSGDLGTFLVSLKESRTVCLAVGQVLNFRKGKSKQNHWRMKMDDLDSEHLGATVAVQMIDLAPRGDVPDKVWRWTKDYIQIQERSTGILTQAHFSVRIPGKNFAPLLITPSYSQQSPVWMIAHQDLDDALTDHWESLNPESQFVFKNMALIPQLSAKNIRLPYKSPTNEAQFVVKDLPVDAQQLPANTSVPCKVCGESHRVKGMREHVGTHILRARRLLELDPTSGDKISEYDQQSMDNLVSSNSSN